MNGRTLVKVLWTLALATVVVLSLQTFVGDVYHVDSASMAPTIFGAQDDGESVLVRYDRSAPERFECTVLLRAGETTPIVKRVVGRPGESVQISNGDLLIDNARLPASAPRPVPITLFDDRWQQVETSFEMGSAESARWTTNGVVGEVDALAVAAGSQAGLMFYKRPLDDGYLAADHSSVAGTTAVNDALLECDVRIEEARGAIMLGLSEQGDLFEAIIRPSADGRAHVRLTRRYRSDADDVLAEAEIAFECGAWHHLRFANVDNVLTFEGSQPGSTLQAVYKENHLHPADLLKEGKSYGPRVQLGAVGARVAFRGLRILRDLYYTQRGQYAVRAPLELGPDEFFVLGDNSADSRDSREWGVVRLAEITGRPIAVVWPLGHLRRLVVSAPLNVAPASVALEPTFGQAATRR